ncbi:hypothetical protein H8R91_04660 [Ruminococcus sp. NSJ-71]|uniref:Uncharacterized protein n=1 Tax=Ruminococcus intestinalis TaxID=2763066 RepID=A0ABR7HJW6_9FIRM|nr:hypothetical protein [Ruminococcus intestinalis]MBC5727823.1 hypothetical protein [Ruminococcus intestinalis]
MSNCKTIAICNQKGGVMGYKMIDSGNIKDCLYSDTDYTEWYVDKYGDLRADESARKDGSVRVMLPIKPKPRRNAGRRMKVISTRSVSANNAAKSFIRTAQGRGFAILTVQKPISRQKQCFLGW